jgi:hypothetical protein
MFYFTYTLQDNQNVPVLPTEATSGLFHNGKFYGFAPSGFALPDGYSMAEISSGVYNAMLREKAFDKLESQYAAQGWSTVRLIDALNMIVQYTITGVPIPENLQANMAVHEANKAKARAANYDFDNLPYSPAEVL